MASRGICGKIREREGEGAGRGPGRIERSARTRKRARGKAEGAEECCPPRRGRWRKRAGGRSEGRSKDGGRKEEGWRKGACRRSEGVRSEGRRGPSRCLPDMALPAWRRPGMALASMQFFPDMRAESRPAGPYGRSGGRKAQVGILASVHPPRISGKNYTGSWHALPASAGLTALPEVPPHRSNASARQGVRAGSCPKGSVPHRSRSAHAAASCILRVRARSGRPGLRP